jgi:hypothetical protein
MVTATRTEEFKLVRTDESTKLYKLPNETDNVASIYLDEYDELELFAGKWLNIKADPIDTPRKTQTWVNERRTISEIWDI